ncbi:hypothetical protein LAZ67_19000714 [Cordylochernes scorpioides]|uniref:Reverse transcriptase zinc-binding domain-containing protein n=1 Tax=Cordylochernes scorpioides TaxID=51811 RepID=A0ABY6LJV2_9ARAC|nr:hypothetical protein LAZ67_19000714 [Cordylochernes scorpioides]
MKLKGRKFDNVDMIQAESKATLRNLSKSDFISCFDNWKKRWNRIKAVEDSSCFCGIEEQTSRHLLIDCPAFQDYRMKNELVVCELNDLISDKNHI